MFINFVAFKCGSSHLQWSCTQWYWLTVKKPKAFGIVIFKKKKKVFLIKRNVFRRLKQNNNVYISQNGVYLKKCYKMSCTVPEIHFKFFLIKNREWKTVPEMSYSAPCISSQEFFFFAKQKNSNIFFFSEFYHMFNSKSSEAMQLTSPLPSLNLHGFDHNLILCCEEIKLSFRGLWTHKITFIFELWFI